MNDGAFPLMSGAHMLCELLPPSRYKAEITQVNLHKLLLEDSVKQIVHMINKEFQESKIKLDIFFLAL